MSVSIAPLTSVRTSAPVTRAPAANAPSLASYWSTRSLSAPTAAPSSLIASGASSTSSRVARAAIQPPSSCGCRRPMCSIVPAAARHLRLAHQDERGLRREARDEAGVLQRFGMLDDHDALLVDRVEQPLG